MTINDLKETASLARLNIDESELAAMLPAFEQMVEYFAEMQKAEDDINAFPDGFAGENGHNTVNAAFFRYVNPISTMVNHDLLDNAGGRDGRFIVTQNILDRPNGV